MPNSHTWLEASTSDSADIDHFLHCRRFHWTVVLHSDPLIVYQIRTNPLPTPHLIPLIQWKLIECLSCAKHKMMVFWVILIFIYLFGCWVLVVARRIVSWGTWDLSVEACGIFSHSMQDLSWGIWDLVPWPRIEPQPPALGEQSLSHWPTTELPGLPSLGWDNWPEGEERTLKAQLTAR